MVGWGHCLLGLNSADAPSLGGLLRGERAHLGQWLAAGFAVVVTDYRGFEEFRARPRLDGISEGYDILELVAAAQTLPYPLSSKWICGGFSQGGHAALAATVRANSHPSGRGLLGTVALAPQLWLSQFMSEATRNPMQELQQAVPRYLTALLFSFPLAGLDSEVPATARRYLTLADKLPRRQYAAAIKGISNEQAGMTGVGDCRSIQHVTASLDFPPVQVPRPLFVAGSDPDEIAPAPLVRAFAEAQAAAGVRTTYCHYDNTEHIDVPVVAMEAAVRFGNGLRAAADRLVVTE
ncbi:alpha/beta fold hydrolase [Amycolatopsis jejuensis]|uniref:alpha/beta fold hydrolase n=1 Tax=Amycolatopsis jejuensis TaxID=330084 RepID=UPI000AD2CD12|nr:alpha/beta fold hydrolase [Amycolatopsis jejuensis]